VRSGADAGRAIFLVAAGAGGGGALLAAWTGTELSRAGGGDLGRGRGVA
jgi:hypothetical protein